MRLFLIAVLVAGAVAAGCHEEKPEWTYYGEVQEYKLEITGDESGWKTTRYHYTYMLTDGREVLDTRLYPMEGIIEGGQLYGYQKDERDMEFEIRPSLSEVRPTPAEMQKEE